MYRMKFLVRAALPHGRAALFGFMHGFCSYRRNFSTVSGEITEKGESGYALRNERGKRVLFAPLGDHLNSQADSVPSESSR